MVLQKIHQLLHNLAKLQQRFQKLKKVRLHPVSPSVTSGLVLVVTSSSSSVPAVVVNVVVVVVSSPVFIKFHLFHCWRMECRNI